MPQTWVCQKLRWLVFQVTKTQILGSYMSWQVFRSNMKWEWNETVVHTYWVKVDKAVKQLACRPDDQILSLSEDRSFFFAITSTPALRSTQPFVQFILRPLSLGIKWMEHGAAHLGLGGLFLYFHSTCMCLWI